jgi:superfamily II DNA or RNA helicase
MSTPGTSSISEPTALALRPYQKEAIAAIEQALERGVRRPMLVLPTGCGKTCVFASLIAKRGGSALVLAHRDELLRQAADKIAAADPTLALGVGFVAAERDDVAAPVVVGSVQRSPNHGGSGGCRNGSTRWFWTKPTTRAPGPTGGSSRT